MGKGMKVWLVIALICILLGGAVFVGVMSKNGWDFTKLSTEAHETNEHLISEDFQDIEIETDTASVVFLPSNDETCKVVCLEREKATHTVAVEEGVLRIKLVDTRKWYDYIGVHFGMEKITVYLPKTEYGGLTITDSTGDIEISKAFQFESMDISVSTGHVENYASVVGELEITTTTGDIKVECVSVGSLALNVSTGKVTVSGVTCVGDITVGVSTGKAHLTDVTCKALRSNGATGDIVLKNVVATENFSIERSTGRVTFQSCDAGEIFVETGTGDVNGTLRSEKVFIVDTGTGSIRVPHSTSGGRCEISTGTGNITIEIEEA